MFSSDLTWAPVAEIGSRTATEIETAPLKPPRRESASRPSTRASTRRPTQTDDNRSLRTAGSVTNLSVFRWGKAKTSYQQRQRAGSNSDTGVWISTEAVVEVREESGPVQLYELPASSVSTTSRQVRRLASFRSTRATQPTSPTSANRPTLTRLSQPQSSTSTSSTHVGKKSHGSQKDIDGEPWPSLWRPPEEWGSSRKSSITNSDYPDSSPRTTIASLAQSRSSVLDGLSPPPKSPGIQSTHRPSIIDTPLSPPPINNPSGPNWGDIQALVRRMTSASPATRLNRATESWPGPLNCQDRDEIAFERDLWLLSELRIRDCAPPSVPDSSTDSSRPAHAIQRPGTSRILDVSSKHADLIQLAALQPVARIAHLAATETESSLHLPGPLPRNVASLPLPLSSSQEPAFPLGDASFDHVRITPSGIGSFSGQQLRALLRECYRVLMVGGILEVRVVDPAPVDVGPASARWIDEELLLAMEAKFRCTRPATLVPVWLKGAGMEVIQGGRACEFRVCVEEAASVEEKLEAELGRWLLKSQYPFVEEWLWEVEACRKECVEKGTRFRVVSLFGQKS